MNESEHSNSRAASGLCCLGLFLAGYIFYSSSLTESFYATEFSLTSWQIGFAQSAVPLGAVIGAMLAGRFADIFGRRRLLVGNFLLLAVIDLLGGFISGFYSLYTIRVLHGFLAGTLYPLCAAFLIEMTPQTSLARQSAILMFINCLAAPSVCLLTILLSYVCNEYYLWRILIICNAIPAFSAYLYARKLPESLDWLQCKKRLSLTQNNSKMTWSGLLNGIKILFNPTYRNLTICLAATWFLMDIAYYGINFFIPHLLHLMQNKFISMSFGHQHSIASSATLSGTLMINIFFMLGALAAFFVIDKFGLIKLQKYGFLIAGISLFVLAGYFHSGMHQRYMIIILFIIFNFALNIGPNITTYLLSATSYPVEIRASGHGFNAGIAKLGAFFGVLLLPKLQDLWGYETNILILCIFLLAGYLLTISLSKTISQETIIKEAEVIYEGN